MKLIRKPEDKKYTGKLYHTNRECGILNSAMLTDHSIIEIGDETIFVMALKLCDACDRNANLLTPLDVATAKMQEFELQQKGEELSAGALRCAAESILEALGDAGYTIRLRSKEANLVFGGKRGES